MYWRFKCCERAVVMAKRLKKAFSLVMVHIFLPRHQNLHPMHHHNSSSSLKLFQPRSQVLSPTVGTGRREPWERGWSCFYGNTAGWKYNSLKRRGRRFSWVDMTYMYTKAIKRSTKRRRKDWCKSDGCFFHISTKCLFLRVLTATAVIHLINSPRGINFVR